MKGTAGEWFDLGSELQSKHISMENVQYVSDRIFWTKYVWFGWKNMNRRNLSFWQTAPAGVLFKYNCLNKPRGNWVGPEWLFFFFFTSTFKHSLSFYLSLNSHTISFASCFYTAFSVISRRLFIFSLHSTAKIVELKKWNASLEWLRWLIHLLWPPFLKPKYIFFFLNLNLCHFCAKEKM